MTEEEWRTSADPARMLAWLEAQLLARQRKLRLFVCACCRLAGTQVRPAVRNMIEAAEDAAEQDPLWIRTGGPVCSRFYDAMVELSRGRLSELEEEMRALALRVLQGADRARECASRVRALCPPGTLQEQADLVRELFGNPFRRVRVIGTHLRGRIAGWPDEKKPEEILFVREWLHWHEGLIVQLADAIHEERAFERLPILADALEDAGCEVSEILAHLREPGCHQRGCWVLDLIRGRE